MAKAINIPPSQYWEGNDGPWSTFSVDVGSPPQQVRVLPATSQSNVWVVWHQILNGQVYSGCPASGGPTDCATQRGVLFDPTASSFQPINSSADDQAFYLPFVPSEQSLPGYNGICEAGFDTLRLENASALPHQVISAYGDTTPFLGLLGLSAAPSNPSHDLTTSYNSTLGALWGTGQVPSRYYAYTAGAPYRTPQTYGSLVFGGYDALRTDESAVVTMRFSEPSDRDLQVVVTGISIAMGTGTLQAPSVTARPFIDSVVPELWLPPAVCATFETAFGLEWNETFSMYFVNDTQHTQLVSLDPKVSISLNPLPGAGSGSTVITLPYASFDLTAKWPLANITDDSSVRYFPLKRAANDTQVILGRTFLQQAYLQVDYDRGNFSLSPALFPDDQSATNIQTVYPPGWSNPQSKGLSTGATAGIAIGAIAAFALCLAIGACCWFRKKRDARKRRESEATMAMSIGPLSTLVDDEVREYFQKPLPSPDPDDNDSKAELDAQTTARGTLSPRYELEAESVRSRPSPRGTVSWGSGVSSLEERMRGYSFGSASPPLSSSSAPSPPLSGHNRHKSIEEQGELFEMAAL